MQGVIIGCLALLTIGMVTWRKPRVHRHPVHLPTRPSRGQAYGSLGHQLSVDPGHGCRMTQGIVVLGGPLPKARPTTSPARIAASLCCSRAMEHFPDEE